MRNSKNVLYIGAGFLILVLLTVVFKFYYPKPQVEPQIQKEADLKYILSATKTNLKVGEKTEVTLYLKGEDAPRVSAYDVKLFYDKDKFKIANAAPGNFFSKYMTIKWDMENSWFALAMSPSSSPDTATPDSPLFTFELTPISKSELTNLSVASSLVYITKTGGFSPSLANINFKIK